MYWDKSLKSLPPCYSLVCNVKTVYGNLKSENFQDYAQKPQWNLKLYVHEFGFCTVGHTAWSWKQQFFSLFGALRILMVCNEVLGGCAMHGGKKQPVRKISSHCPVKLQEGITQHPTKRIFYAPLCTQNRSPDAGVLKKLSSAGLAQLSRLGYSWLRFGLASADYSGLRVHDRPVNTAG